MPKKFKGVNTKAEEARARKTAAKHAEKERKDREAEDKLWEDNDKHVARKQLRKENKEAKKHEALERKQANRQLLEEEETTIKSKAAAAAPPTKVTQAQISEHKERQTAEQLVLKTKEQEKTIHDEPLEENPNQKMAELLAAEGAVEARSVEDAISTLSVDKKMEKHPEKRVKAAYAEFEERELPRLKQENPNLRMSQLKQILRKDWMKSPENPLNAAHLAYNAKR